MPRTVSSQRRSRVAHPDAPRRRARRARDRRQAARSRRAARRRRARAPGCPTAPCRSRCEPTSRPLTPSWIASFIGGASLVIAGMAEGDRLVERQAEPLPARRREADVAARELAQMLGGRLVGEPQLDPRVALGGRLGRGATCLRSTWALTTSRSRGSSVAANASSTGSSGLRWPRKPPGKTKRTSSARSSLSSSSLGRDLARRPRSAPGDSPRRRTGSRAPARA